MNTIRNNFSSVGMVIACLFLAYWAIAATVFQFRHAWMTETELFLHTPDALQFKSVSYKESRPRD